MSLRARLTVQNMMIVGGILFLFGAVLYSTFRFVLFSQVNNRLVTTGDKIIAALDVDQRGGLIVKSETNIDLTLDVLYQVWGRAGNNIYSSMNLSGRKEALDPLNLGPSTTLVRDVLVGNVPVRVMSRPVYVRNSDRMIGVIQVGVGLSYINAVLKPLLVIVVVGSVVASGLAGLAGWFSTGRALKPLNLVRDTALQITRADDLSRRIPYQGSPEDEVGQLILAFNQTLSRLENLFNSQRRFLTDVGHELRTPLTVIRGNIDLMRRMNCTDDESMDSIQVEVERLTRLVGDLLLLAQAEAGQIPMAHRIVELDTLLLDVMQQMHVLAHGRLKLRMGEVDQVQVCGDHDRLKQVLVNLIGNAIKYTPDGGEVVVGVGKDAKNAWLRVSDTGPGIPEDDLPFIFDRFYRGEKSRRRTKDGKGFGLGLSIAYWIVHSHAGRIEVSSNQPHGTTFRVWLPLDTGPCPEE